MQCFIRNDCKSCCKHHCAHTSRFLWILIMYNSFSILGSDGFPCTIHARCRCNFNTLMHFNIHAAGMHTAEPSVQHALGCFSYHMLLHPLVPLRVSFSSPACRLARTDVTGHGFTYCALPNFEFLITCITHARKHICQNGATHTVACDVGGRVGVHHITSLGLRT